MKLNLPIYNKDTNGVWYKWNNKFSRYVILKKKYWPKNKKDKND